MTDDEQRAELLIVLTRYRHGLTDVTESLTGAGLPGVAEQVKTAARILDEARQSIMAVIRMDGEAAGRKR